MSYIKNFYDTYRNLDRIFILNTKMRLEFLGFYDREQFGIEWDLKYKGGLFPNKNGDGYYDDLYKNKQAIELSFLHNFFGNYPILKNIGIGSHLHTKCFVSTNDIELSTVYTMSNNDLIFFADLTVSRKVINGGEYTLYELTPHLTPDELSELKTDILGQVVDWKEQVINAETNRKMSEADAFILMSRAIAAETSLETFKLYTAKMLDLLKQMNVRMKTVSISATHEFNEMLKDVENELDLDYGWDNIVSGVVEKGVKKGDELERYFKQISELNNRTASEEMKNLLVEKVVSICGVEKVQEILDRIRVSGSARGGIATPAGFTEHFNNMVRNGELTPEQARAYNSSAANELFGEWQKDQNLTAALQRTNGNLKLDDNNVAQMIEAMKTRKATPNYPPRY